ncbi:MAG: galactose mutarotase [Oscillospiraceae bacterium]|nr:galactose mutarotase [Oscillospiraceae bacterium]
MSGLENFGQLPNGETVWLATIENSKGMKAKIITYGGIMHSVVLADGVDVILGKQTLEDYLSDGGNSAAVIGRVANRIKDAAFELDGKRYELLANDRGNCLHGGGGMYAARNFIVADIARDSVKLAVFDKGEGGFPGEVDVTVRYTVTEDDELKICYHAVASENTPINLTNHVYFNLAGHDSGAIYAQELFIDADFHTPSDENVLTTGEIESVEGTPVDFRSFKDFRSAMDELQASGSVLGGFDHSYVLKGCGYRKVAVARDPASGRFMETYTDLPGVQLYTGNHLTGKAGKNGAAYHKHAGFCLETQFFPDSINKPHFPSSLLMKDTVFTTCTAYRFGKE